MPDLFKIKANVKKMVGMNAPESDIDRYLELNRVSPSELKDVDISGVPVKLKRGERSFVGNVFERPGAAVRQAILSGAQGKNVLRGYHQGAAFPEEVPMFQDLALDKYYETTDPLVNKFSGTPILGRKMKEIRDIAGYGVSAGGMGLDFATNPADLIGLIGGNAPGVNKLVSIASKTKAAKAAGRFMNKKRYLTETSDQLYDKATRIFRDIIRPEKGEVKAINIRQSRDINKIARLGAEENLPIEKTFDNKLSTKKAIEQIPPKIKSIYNELSSLLETKPDKTFDLMDIRKKTFRLLKKTSKNASKLKTDLKYVDEYIGDEIQRHGQLVNASVLNDIKQGMWSVGYENLRPTSKETARKIGYSIKKTIENAFPDKDVRGLNAKIGDYETLITLLENAEGRGIKGGRLGGYAARGMGTIVGGLAGQAIPIPGVGPVVGAMLGNEAGARFASRIYDPARRAAQAGKLAAKAAKKATKKIKPEILSKRIIPKLGTGIAFHEKIPLQITGKGQLSLPSPKDVPYTPPGYRTPPLDPRFRMPNESSGPPINLPQGGTPEEVRRIMEAARLKEEYQKWLESKYVSDIQMLMGRIGKQ